MFLWNAGIQPTDYTVKEPRRQPLYSHYSKIPNPTPKRSNRLRRPTQQNFGIKRDEGVLGHPAP